MRYGVWIDHAKALIINVDSGSQSPEIIHSEVEPHHHGGVAEGEHLTIVNQNQHNHAREHEMHAFVKKLLHVLADATEIVIYGPGNAKFDLKKGLEHEKSMEGKLKSCETTDKLTDEEFWAHLRKAYNLA
jgi:hypothetical protein